MDQHYPLVDMATDRPVKMGSNNGFVVGGAIGNCNGTPIGVIMSSSSKLGKQQLLNCHSIVVTPEEDVVYPQQNHIVHTSSQPLSSPLQATSAHIDPKEVAQVMNMSARNGYMKTNTSMDHNLARQNISRPDVQSAALQSQHPHNFYSAAAQQHSMFSGNSMGGVVVEGDFARESQMFRTPAILTPSGASSHSYREPIVIPDSPPPRDSQQDEPAGKTFGRKRSRKRPKTCGVCSDRAKSFHFGGLSCDSCKAFFRRSVQNDAHVAFRCAYDSCCDINISTRKSCQFCRFKKCLSIGMEKSWVMTEEERNALNQQRMEKKQSKPSGSAEAASTDLQPQQPPTVSVASPSSAAQPSYTFQGSINSAAVVSSKEPSALAFQESEYVADVNKMLDYMTAEEQQEIKTVVETYLYAYKKMPFQVSFEEGRRDTLEIIEMFTTILRRFAFFAKLIPEFADLDRNDQGNLLRAAVLEMCLLRGAACFDTDNNRWPSSTMESLKDCPQLRVEDMQRLVSRELFDMHITFILHMKRLRIDEPIAMLLIMTLLFCPERIPVENKVKVNQSQEKYLMLLKKYVIWKFGSTAGSRVYPQLLTKLSDLRQLNDFHTEFHLNLDSKEVNAIKKSLEELNLNPYPNWKIVPESNQTSPEDSQITSPSSPPTASKIPRVTSAIIQSFADRRIPTLLDNPYATFETDLTMIRQVQQTLGSLFPSSGLSSSFIAHAQQRQSGTSTDSATTTRAFHDPLIDLENSGETSLTSPTGYSSSTDSVELQTAEFLQSSRSQEYHLGDATSSSSTHRDGQLNSGEYHADRFHRFLNKPEPEHAIKDLNTVTTFASVLPTVISGSQQTVLRKHSSAGSSLPGTPSSVIRSAPARQTGSSTSVILQHSSSIDAQPIRSMNHSTNNAGWHREELHTATTNGHHQVISTADNTVQGRIHPPLYNRDEFSDTE